MPVGAEFSVVDTGLRRDLRTSAYAVRVAECEAAAAVVGPLGLAGPDDIAGLRDPRLRRRTRHVVGECARVDAFADALAAEDLVTAGALMDESHASLAVDFDASTAEIDALVADVRAHPGVLGARMTGAGWGGCLVVLAEPGALELSGLGAPPGAGARRRHGGPPTGVVTPGRSGGGAQLAGAVAVEEPAVTLRRTSRVDPATTAGSTRPGCTPSTSARRRPCGSASRSRRPGTCGRRRPRPSGPVGRR